jgi:hypothetical protein
MRRALYLGIPVLVLNLKEIVQALREEGLDTVYEKLEELFFTGPFVVINREGKVIFFPYETEEIFTFLEVIDRKFNNEEEV